MAGREQLGTYRLTRPFPEEKNFRVCPVTVEPVEVNLHRLARRKISHKYVGEGMTGYRLQGGGDHFHSLIAYDDDLSGYVSRNDRDGYPLEDGMRGAQRLYVMLPGPAEGDCEPAADQEACDADNHLGGTLICKAHDHKDAENNRQQKHGFPFQPRGSNHQPAEPEQGSDHHVPQKDVCEETEKPESDGKK